MGRAIAILFANEGAIVVGLGRTKSKADATIGELQSIGGGGLSLGGDVSVEADCEAAVQETIDAYGRIDILINAAGVGNSWREQSPGSMNPVHTTSTEKWREVMGINLDSMYYMSKFVVPHMKAQGGGTIVHVASISSFAGSPAATAYITSKGAIISLTRHMAVAYAGDNIRTNALFPGYTDTPMLASAISVFDNEQSARTACPMGRAGTPMEMAYGALYVASDEASYTNGIALLIDGGSLAKI